MGLATTPRENGTKTCGSELLGRTFLRQIALNYWVQGK